MKIKDEYDVFKGFKKGSSIFTGAEWFKISLTFLAGIIIVSFCRAQQYPVTITIAVSPPYSPKVNEYIARPNKIMAILLNGDNRVHQVYLLGSITGGGGIKVFTDPGHKMPQPVVLQPGIPFQLNQSNIQQVFSPDHLIFQGITKNEVLNGNGLPEGEYSICLEAYDYQTGQPVSQPAPEGCSNAMAISKVDPPVMLRPVSGDSVKSCTPQNVIFSWTKPPGSPADAVFDLKIIEILPGDLNPEAAMKDPSHPVFFEKRGIATTIILGPSDPQLVTGKNYACAVKISDPSNKTVFRNDGMSEVNWFKPEDGSQNNTQNSCICTCSPAVYPVLKQGNKWTYVAGGTFSCSGFCGTGPEVTVCEKKKVTHKWSISSGKEIAGIDGATDRDTVILNIRKKGDFVLHLNSKLECTCESCEGGADAEESVPEDPPGNCLCVIESELVGGPPIKILRELSAYVKPMVVAKGEKPVVNQTLAVGMSVLASDMDDLVHRCVLGGPWEKLVKDVGDPVSYSWELEEGRGAKIIGNGQGTAMLILPNDIKTGEELTFRIKCTVSSGNGDDELTGYVKAVVTGNDTCELLKIETEVEPMSKGTPKEVKLSEKGRCIPVDNPKWIQADPVSAKISAPAHVPVGEMTLVGIEANDQDRLTIKCKSDGCGNPEKSIALSEGLKFDWNDGGAGGKFIPAADGRGIIYQAPEKEGTVTITCNLADMGNHREASGEKLTVKAEIKVVDVLKGVHLGKVFTAKQFLTAGTPSDLVPDIITDPGITVLRADWCLDLGGENGQVKATARTGKKPLKPENLILRLSDSREKDRDLIIHWNNHHHIHDKHPLVFKLSYMLKGNDIPYLDGAWTESNFLEGTTLDTFRLFFDGRVNALKDDGKWRSMNAHKDDIYGEPAILRDHSNVPPWLLHWAKETYNPAIHGYSLKSEDPKIYYRKSFEATGGSKPNAEYRWKGSYEGKTTEDLIYVSDLAISPSTRAAFSKPGQKIVTSDMKITSVDVFLPKINVSGIGSAIRCINHELAHWEAITANWRPGGEWQKIYGDHTVFKTWKDVNDGKKIDLKNITYTGVKQILEFNVVSGKDAKAEVKGSVKEGKTDIYDMIITCKNVVNRKNKNPVDEVTITLPGAWFVDGSVDPKKGELNSTFTLYSQNIPGIKVTHIQNDKNPPETKEYSDPADFKNGIVIIREGSTNFKIYERHNDPDGDWIPNAVEDLMGTNWLLGRTYPEKTYHENPNDQEFWAEWRIKDLFDPDTGKLSDEECKKEKDWANPGLQTIPEKKK